MDECWRINRLRQQGSSKWNVEFMIERYSRAVASGVWNIQTKLRLWLDIEIYACEALAQLGKVPAYVPGIISEKTQKIVFDVERIEAIEKRVKHDVIAFLTYISEIVGDEARFLHQGLTSSDILDTCLSAQLTMVTHVLLEDINSLLIALKKKAFDYKLTPCIGRSHGVHAEPTTFGLKMALAYSEFSRNKKRLQNALEEISVCALSGAVGTFAHVPPFVESYVAKKMGLQCEKISTQIIPRDRHAMYFTTLAVVASSIERLAIEIRHLQRSEILEVEEYFSEGQKGSSAMPHKRNPILSENLTGLARMVRSMSFPAMENVALWHERDISHSSAERMIAPDSTVTLDFALDRLANVVDRLLVYPDAMKSNMSLYSGAIYSQRVLLTLIEKGGFTREEAYKIVQTHAMDAWNKKENLCQLLERDTRIQSCVSTEELRDLFNDSYHLRYVDNIFERVFSDSEENNGK